MALPDALFIGHMLSAMDRIVGVGNRTTKEEFDDDWILQDAVMRELEILGEAAGRVSPEFVAAHPEIPWKEITGLRHKLIHDYFEVDLDIVWHTATNNIPELLPLVRAVAESNRR